MAFPHEERNYAQNDITAAFAQKQYASTQNGGYGATAPSAVFISPLVEVTETLMLANNLCDQMEDLARMMVGGLGAADPANPAPPQPSGAFPALGARAAYTRSRLNLAFEALGSIKNQLP